MIIPKWCCTGCDTVIPPNFVRGLEDKVVLEQEMAQFACEVFPWNSHIEWFVKGIKVKEGIRYKMGEDLGKRTLRIHRCTKDDEGRVYAKTGDMETDADLYVKGAIT